MRLTPPILAAMLSLTACQSTPRVYDVPTSQSYDRQPAAIWPVMTGFLDANGLAVVETSQATGRIVATLVDYQPRGWAACRPARVFDRHDDKNRPDRGRPVDRRLELEIQVRASDHGSEVRPRATFSERQINPFKNLPFRVRCPSTGDLERALLAAIDGG